MAFCSILTLGFKNDSFRVVCSMAFIYNSYAYAFSQKCFSVEVKNINGWLFFKVFNLNLFLFF